MSVAMAHRAEIVGARAERVRRYQARVTRAALLG
jgi:hypothetical protein